MRIPALEKTMLIYSMMFILLYMLPLILYGNEISVPLVLLLFIILPTHLLCKIFLVKRVFQNIFEAFHTSVSIMLLLFILLPTLHKLLSIDRIYLQILVAIIAFSLFVASNYLDRDTIQSINKERRKTLKLHLVFIASVLVVLYLLLGNVPRLYTPDETSYVFHVQLFEQYGVMPSFGVSPYSSTLSKYIVGRHVWISYLFSIKFFTGVEPYRIHLATTLFIVLLVSISLALLNDTLRIPTHKLLLLATLAIISSPAVLPWSITVLLDLPQHYFILVSIYFILRSVRIVDGVINDIDLRMFLLGIIYAFLSVLFKANIIILAVPIVVAIIELYRNRTHLAERAKMTFKILATLLITAATYVLIVDFGRFISWFFFNNWELANTLRKYLIYEWSIAEGLFGMFVEIPWERYTVFSYSWEQWLDFVNLALTPEALTILFSSTFLTLPFLIIMVRSLRLDIRFRILATSTWMSFWLYFFILIGSNQLNDFTRYALGIYILLMISSITALHRVMQSNNASKTFTFVTLSMIILLFVNHIVTLEFGGTRFFFDMMRYRYSFLVLLAQAGLTILYTMSSRGNKALQRSFLPVFLLFSLVSFSIFNNVVFTGSGLYSSTALEDVRESLESMSLDTSRKPRIVVSNFYIYLRNYVDLEEFIPIPPPITEDEFREMLKLLPEGSIIALTNDPRLSWYEYGNRYIKKYLNEEYIPIEYLGPYKTPTEPQIELLINESIKIPSNARVVVNGSYGDSRWGRAVALDGIDDCIAIYNYSLGNTYTIELLFRMDEDPADFGTYPEDVPLLGGKPVTKSLLAKRYHGLGEIMISITSDGEVVVGTDNKDNKPRFEIRTGKGIIREGEWYHLILVVNNEHARLYINGVLTSESKVSGENMVLEEEGIKEEPLYIGTDGTSVFKPWRYLKATIKLLRIYDKALSQEEIATLYAHIKRFAIIKLGNYVYAIYVKEGVSNREPTTSATPAESKIKLLDVVMNLQGSCTLKIDSSLNSPIILATIRFTKIVNLSKGIQTLSFPFIRNINADSKVKEATYICSYHITLDSSSNILWLYVRHGMNSLELLVYYATLLILLIIVISGKFLIIRNNT